MRQRDRLAAILRRSHLSDNLRGNIAGSRETVRLFNQRARDNGAVLQHILEVYQVAVVHVLRKVVRIVEVNEALIVGCHYVGRKQYTLS